MNCCYCEREIVGEGIKKKRGTFCNEKCIADYTEFNKEFMVMFKKQIIGNENVMKKMVKAVSEYAKMPKGSKVVKESLAAEFAKIWVDEIEGA